MTPQQLKAMKLALEALEVDAYVYNGEKSWKAITALKEALAEHAMRETQRLGQEIEQEPVAWLLTDKKINSLQVDDIHRLIDRLKHAHHTDLCVRINGQDEWFEADWLKHMVRVAPPQRTEQEPAGWEVGVVDGVVTRRLAPPQRKPLSAEQVSEICAEWTDENGNTGSFGRRQIARAIEAAHDIKENT